MTDAEREYARVHQQLSIDKAHAWMADEGLDIDDGMVIEAFETVIPNLLDAILYKNDEIAEMETQLDNANQRIAELEKSRDAIDGASGRITEKFERQHRLDSEKIKRMHETLMNIYESLESRSQLEYTSDFDWLLREISGTLASVGGDSKQP